MIGISLSKYLTHMFTLLYDYVDLFLVNKIINQNQIYHYNTSTLTLKIITH